MFAKAIEKSIGMDKKINLIDNPEPSPLLIKWEGAETIRLWVSNN